MKQYLNLAYQTAKEGVENNEGGPFGAVIVKDDEVIAVAHNEVLKRNDPTAHAEMLAIQEASKKLGRFHLQGCVLYTTGEPCPMCFSAIHWAHIDKVVYCNTKEEAALIGFDDRFITDILEHKINSPISFLHYQTNECKELLKLWETKEDKLSY